MLFLLSIVCIGCSVQADDFISKQPFCETTTYPTHTFISYHPHIPKKLSAVKPLYTFAVKRSEHPEKIIYQRKHYCPCPNCLTGNFLGCFNVGSWGSGMRKRWWLITRLKILQQIYEENMLLSYNHSWRNINKLWKGLFLLPYMKTKRFRDQHLQKYFCFLSFMM